MREAFAEIGINEIDYVIDEFKELGIDISDEQRKLIIANADYEFNSENFYDFVHTTINNVIKEVIYD